MNPSIQIKKGKAVFLLVLICFGLAPASRAVSPPPDGGYPGKNTAEGNNALLNLTTGVNNTAIGFNALRENGTASQNTATGVGALRDNRDGINNTADGYNALAFNTIGDGNTAVGNQSLYRNTIGVFNTANGDQALFNNTGSFNTADGVQALFKNTNGEGNTASGIGALFNNTTGGINTADGVQALFKNTTGSYNTASGADALLRNTTGSQNIALGLYAGQNLTTGDFNIDIGNEGVAGESNTIRIGEQGNHSRTFVAGISGSPIGGTSVVVNNFGQLGTVASSQRFKEAIKPMDKASEAILALQPVTFHYKKEVDPNGILQFGLVAEQVQKVNPDLVVRDAEGKVYSVRYEAVNAMLLNEFLKDHKKVEEQQSRIEKQEATIVHQQKQIDALTAGLQKMSVQIGASKPAPQVVNNP